MQQCQPSLQRQSDEHTGRLNEPDECDVECASGLRHIVASTNPSDVEFEIKASNRDLFVSGWSLLVWGRGGCGSGWPYLANVVLGTATGRCGWLDSGQAILNLLA